MLIFAFDDEEIWRNEIEEACSDRGFAARVFCNPDRTDIEEVMQADVVVCDNKFESSGYLGADFIRILQDRNFRGTCVLYTNFPRSTDQAMLGDGAHVITKENSFDSVLDLVIGLQRAAET